MLDLGWLEFWQLLKFDLEKPWPLERFPRLLKFCCGACVCCFCCGQNAAISWSWVAASCSSMMMSTDVEAAFLSDFESVICEENFVGVLRHKPGLILVREKSHHIFWSGSLEHLCEHEVGKIIRNYWHCHWWPWSVRPCSNLPEVVGQVCLALPCMSHSFL